MRWAKQQAFSLLELIIVITITAILAISLTSLTEYSITGYIDAKDRNQLSQSAKWTTERIAREAREALPQSIRVNVNAGVHCVEFMNIVNGSTYLNLPSNGAITSFNAVEFDINFSAGLIVAIMPINPTDIYSVAGTLGDVASIVDLGNQSQINLTGPTTFSRRSPQDRFYLLTTPISFCLDDTNGQLTRYSGYPIALAQPTPPAAGNSELIAENYRANGTVFNYQAGTLSRAGLLQINFQMQNRNRNLAGNEEAFDVFHEVHIRNVP
ncbi:type II secretion system protein [Aliikangiella marina]|uniref:Type II secretion system protein n=1 Tax=Aliikangiella marina TaxID=1712262 RepID=A0A545T482_9GAMM|nr:type II secretion system protein [Aliikangiella marina]TQV71984.1 type II secretion system protein [Aliikangiella marina]TQV72037.1 type II secretion system protein [Aliikangiella marina]